MQKVKINYVHLDEKIINFEKKRGGPPPLNFQSRKNPKCQNRYSLLVQLVHVVSKHRGECSRRQQQERRRLRFKSGYIGIFGAQVHVV